VHALVERLLAHGFRGATVFRGVEGFGSHRRISVDWTPDAPGDLPMLIEVAEGDLQRVRTFLATIDEVLEDGLVTVERIQRLVCASKGT
jgi:PII-like signaling protein